MGEGSFSRPTEALTLGVHHVGLTVPNLAETRAFFTDVLGFTVLGGVEDYPSSFVTDGKTMITLWQAKAGATALPFDREQHIGLHHIAFAVADIPALEALHERLAAQPGVTMEFAPEPIQGTHWTHFICRIPGGIRVEFATP